MKIIRKNNYISTKLIEFINNKNSQIEKDKNKIYEILNQFYICAKGYESEKEFTDYYDEKIELRKLKEKYPIYYQDQFSAILKKFKINLNETKKNNKTKMKKIDKFFKDEFNKIFDLNEDVLKKQLEDYKQKDINIKDIIKEKIIKNYFDEKLEQFKKIKFKEAILNEIKLNYINILKISNEVDDFITKMTNKLQENENIKKLLDLKDNTDYKDFLNEYFLENSKDISKDLGDKLMKQKNDVNEFFVENYQDLLDLYKNSTPQELDNNFEQFLIQKSKQDIKNYPNFKFFKKKNFEDFQSKKELEQFSKKNELEQFFSINSNNISNSCKDEAEFREKIDIFLNTQNKQDLKNHQDFDKILKEKWNLFKKDKEILKNDVIDFFNEYYIKLFNECQSEDEFGYKIDQKLIEQKKENLKNSFNYEDILKDKKELFRKEKEFKKKEEEIINQFFSNFTQDNFEDIIAIEKFKNFLDIEKANSICNYIFEKGNFNTKIENKISNYTNELLNDDTVKVRHLNIILCGTSGAGKSTLINNILKLEGNNKQKTGIGVHQTETTGYVESQNIPYIRCADSRGTEIGNYNINKVKKDIKDFIDKQKATGDPDTYIHCIWYCLEVGCDRFHNEEAYFLRDIQSIYSMRTLPVIIVGTKDFFEDTEELRNDLINRDILYPFIPTLAEEKISKNRQGNIIHRTEPHGLDELKKETFQKAGEAIESACFNGIINKIITKSFEKIEKEKNKIKENILQNISTNINFSNFPDLENEMKKIFIFIIDKYAAINLCSVSNQNEINYNFNSDERINSFINDCYNYFLGEYKKGYELKIYSELEKLSVQINNVLLTFNQDENTNFKVNSREKNISSLKPKLEEKLKEIAIPYYSKNCYNLFLNKLLEELSTRFFACYEKYIKEIESVEEKRKKVKDKITNQFEELKNTIENNANN